MSGRCQGCGAALPPPPTRGGRERKWCSDRCRKRTLYAGTCIDCGGPTNGSDGRGPNAAKRCFACARVVKAERNARIFEAWGHGDTARQIGEREGMKVSTVLELVKNHRAEEGLARRKRPSRELWPHIERRWNEGALLAEIAAECDTNERNIAFMVQTMRRVGIDLPYRSRRKAAA